ncbi:hydroxyethylthiazole kinase [Halobacillus sp. ACCC02827]|uniref:hydroxyethylthiazole kinase n=1 Tax=Halobacillus sp. ACCC02827 TaxID=3052090 RepID=UPI002570CBA1|nr:hydroxyethylthiazole kinase [Halobacillus sp. ACCC02827]WJE15598.1 hydroxyethylthiazole kinase [Halobacillus sp. ACCC02827]
MNTIIEKVREKRPLIHHITNQVVVHFTANGALAFGSSPIMAAAHQEAADVAMLADGVLLNIGTLNDYQVESMILAGRAANEKGIPVVLDPVGVGATKYRYEAFQRIVKEVQPTVIKGNAGELARLVDIEVETKGVDSVGEGNTGEIVQAVAEALRTAVVCTGAVDRFCADGKSGRNESGHPLLGRVTGSGCLLGSILAAVLSVDGGVYEKLETALKHYGRAAEQAASLPSVQGPGTFLPHFLDALSRDLEEGI